MIDCLVIGSGPAGLTASIYLARYHLSVTVVDDGQSRAAQIPLSRNHAGFPEGISGEDLLARMRRQALRYGASTHSGRVDTLERAGKDFKAIVDGAVLRARSVLLATGVIKYASDSRRSGAEGQDVRLSAASRGAAYGRAGYRHRPD